MNNTINEKLGAWLLVDGNTKNQLAAILGISRPSLNSKLAGKTPWKWDEVVTIARLTSCTLDELAGLND